MNNTDFAELAATWRTERHDNEIVALAVAMKHQTARARRFAIVEYGVSGAVALVVMYLMLETRAPAALIAGAASLIAIGLAAWTVMRLRRGLFDTAPGDARALVDLAIRRSRSAVKRYRLGLYGLLPSTAIGALFGYFLVSSDPGGRLQVPFGPLAGWPVAALGAIVLAVVAVVTYRLMRREEKALARFSALQSALGDD